ncbi:hypothetical protein BC628DRAFT_40105 [Trametes gibbosa]|nr:hypothetical protein BC628DRAFT_40105 [Trametes gibbosa]
MIPKHSNPYLLHEHTAIVSRAALRGDSDDELREALDADPGRAQMLARLENILKRSIEDVLPAGLQSSAATAGGESPRKNKRRKVDEEAKVAEEQQPVVVPFRLLSGTSQPKSIVLTPKAARVLVSVGPAYEDTKEEAERRAARARAVAVDFDQILADSHIPHRPLPNAAKKVRTLRATRALPSPAPPLVLLERPKPAPAPTPPSACAPCPHAHHASCCPVLPASGSDAGAGTAPPADRGATRKRPRRGQGRSGRQERPAVQPAFWRPRQGAAGGGTNRGYAWGYEGSWPAAERGTARRYRRDEMRRGVVA